MITFVAPMFKEEWEPYMFIGSLMSQTNSNWSAIIYINGGKVEEKWKLQSFLDSVRCLGKITIEQSEKNTGCWGVYNREYALQNLVDSEYIINTSIQDYWIPTAVEEILRFNGSDFIYFNSINHIFNYDNILNCEPIVGKIDWGNFAVKTEIAKKVGINQPKEFCADGYFVQDLMNSGLINIKSKINKILTIHN